MTKSSKKRSPVRTNKKAVVVSFKKKSGEIVRFKATKTTKKR